MSWTPLPIAMFDAHARDCESQPMMARDAVQLLQNFCTPELDLQRVDAS